MTSIPHRPNVYNVAVPSTNAVAFDVPDNAVSVAVKVRDDGGDDVAWNTDPANGSGGAPLAGGYATLTGGEGFETPNIPTNRALLAPRYYFALVAGGSAAATVEVVVS